MQNKPLLAYPEHHEFEELLNSCGSMTKQLENLGRTLSVSLLHEGIEDNYFRRYTVLNLNQLPVVIACSSTDLNNPFFTTLLQNANTTPIGKFLFASQSQVIRSQIEIELITAEQISLPHLKDFVQRKYQPSQPLWQRLSVFNYQQETMQLCEVMLPELELFY